MVGEIRPGLGGKNLLSYRCPNCDSHLVCNFDQLTEFEQCPDCTRRFRFADELVTSLQSKTYSQLAPNGSTSALKAIGFTERFERITVAKLSDFISDIREPEVVIRFPHGQTKSDIQSIRRINATMNPVSYVFSPDYCFYLTKADKTSGHLTMNFETATVQVTEQYHMLERGIENDESSKSIIANLQSLESRIEVGIDPITYGEALTSIWHESKKALKRSIIKFPCFCHLLQVCVMLHLNALNTLRRGANLSGMSFAGIGFGIRGAAEAFAVAYGLNSLVGAYNQNSAKKHAQSLDYIWKSVSLILRDLEVNFPSLR